MGLFHHFQLAPPSTTFVPNCWTRGVVGQIGLDRKQVVRLALFARARRKRLQRISITIDARDPHVCRQQAPHHRPADTARRTGFDLRLATMNGLLADQRMAEATDKPWPSRVLAWLVRQHTT